MFQAKAGQNELCGVLMPGLPGQNSGLPTPLIVFIIIFCVLFVAGLIRGIVFTARRRRILKSAGLSPMMAPVQMEARLAQSAMFAPAPGLPELAKPLEQRPAELDDLRNRGVITEDERAAARAKILADD
jgi:hypothetical protein